MAFIFTPGSSTMKVFDESVSEIPTDADVIICKGTSVRMVQLPSPSKRTSFSLRNYGETLLVMTTDGSTIAKEVLKGHYAVFALCSKEWKLISSGAAGPLLSDEEAQLEGNVTIESPTVTRNVVDTVTSPTKESKLVRPVVTKVVSMVDRQVPLNERPLTPIKALPPLAKPSPKSK